MSRKLILSVLLLIISVSSISECRNVEVVREKGVIAPRIRRNSSLIESGQLNVTVPGGDQRKPRLLPGGRILFATDDFYTAAEGLLSADEPTFNTWDYTKFGKTMDGWETRRKRIAGHDWTIIALNQPAVIKEICADTAFFLGNFPPTISIQAARLNEEDWKKFPPRNGSIGTAASEEDMKIMAALKTDTWKTIVPKSPLAAGYPDTRKTYLTVESNLTWTHLRLNMYPDGGIARLRIYGVTADDRKMDKRRDLIDLVNENNGGRAINASNAFYQNPKAMIRDYESEVMPDAWETARRPDRPDIVRISDDGTFDMEHLRPDWAILKLGKVGTVESIIIDTAHHPGNSPYSASIDGIYSPGNNPVNNESHWISVLPMKILKPSAKNVYNYEDIENVGKFTHVKINIVPDGGIARLRIMGYPA